MEVSLADRTSKEPIGHSVRRWVNGFGIVKQ
jgi:hypothetical protein